MSVLSTVMALGLFLGMRHATDPDHVVAVATIVSHERRMLYAALIGALWGFGHTITIVIVGSAIILLNLTIPPALGLTMEFCVACMLILLGLLNLTGFLGRAMERIGAHGYSSGMHAHIVFGRIVIHNHGRKFMAPGNGSSVAWLPHCCRKLGVYRVVRPFVVGIVHGLAGSAAVALLVLATIRQSGWAIVYLLVFGLGTIVGMMLITVAIALPFTYTLRHFARLGEGLAIASGAISVVFGLFLCYQIGFHDGLFTGHLDWIPH
jgi:hypothetical protein